MCILLYSTSILYLLLWHPNLPSGINKYDYDQYLSLVYKQRKVRLLEDVGGLN